MKRTLKIEFVPHGKVATHVAYHEVDEVTYLRFQGDLESYCKGVCQVAGGRYVRHVVQRHSQSVAA